MNNFKTFKALVNGWVYSIEWNEETEPMLEECVTKKLNRGFAFLIKKPEHQILCMKFNVSRAL